MVFTPQAVMSTNRLLFINNIRLWSHPCKSSKGNLHLSRIRASSGDDVDCNVEECAPDKEVGKVSMEWLAGEKTKVVGTFPPRNQQWTGYVEKDTAGQTNIYSIEPTVYVAESAVSSGTAGSSTEGAENTVAITAGFALITIAAASLTLLLLNKNSPPQIQTIEYSGPSLAYYIKKFKPQETVQASVSTEPETSVSVQAEAAVPEVTNVQVESGYRIEDGTSPAPDASVRN